MLMLKEYCLLVDDDKLITDLMAPFLKMRGYNPISVHSGQKAIDIIITSNPKFVILDINLPDMSGFEVLRAIRNKKHASEIPVFMLTGYTEPVNQLASFDIGATEFFSKTINPQDIIAQIQDIIWNRGS